MNLRQKSKIFAALLGLTLFTGCATTSQLDLVRDEAQTARRTADQALNVAQDANARSLKTEEMVNRSFKKSMRK